MKMKRRKYSSILLLAVSALHLIFFGVSSVFSQDVFSEGFTGRGVSKIVDGDMASARLGALEDAKKKVVMEAVCAGLSLEDITKYYLTLKNLFIDHPEIYLQRFKIVTENALFDSYNVTIQGFVQYDQLRNDLSTMGVIGSGRKKVKILLMLAEKGMDSPDETFWWSSNEKFSSSRYRSQHNLEKYFIEKGAYVIDPSQIPESIYSEKIGQSSEPVIEEAIWLASRVGASLVVVGKSELTRVDAQKLSSLASIQCDMGVRVIDVHNGSIVVQAATYALGIHVDESSAALDAIDKASRHLSGQIMDTVYLTIRNRHEYVFELAFDKPVTDTEVRRWLDAFLTAFPEIEMTEVENNRKKQIWSVKLLSRIESADILQKMFETGCEGYQTEVVSVNDDVIKLMISRN